MTEKAFELDAILSKYSSKPAKAAKPELLAVYGQPGCGKGLAYGTPVYTPHGPVPVEKLRIGDSIIGSNGKPTRVFGIWDRGELDTFLIDFNDGSSVTVDGDHLWTVRQRTDHEWKTVNTISLFEKINLKNSKNYEVPVTLPVEFEGSDLPIPPYMMGGLLADGYLAGTTVQWTKNNQDVADRMCGSAELKGWTLEERTRHSASVRQWRFTKEGEYHKPQSLQAILEGYGLRVHSDQKFIPRDYLLASAEDRWELLHGLFDGDGRYRADRGLAQYTSTSKQLVTDVRELCWSLGIPARMENTRRTDGTWSLSLFTGFNPFSACEWAEESFEGNHYVTGRQMVKITPAGKAQTRCLAVEAADQLFVTQDYIVTHNSYFAGTVAGLPNFKKGLILDTEGSTVGVVTDQRFDVIRVDKQPDPFKFLSTILSKGKQGLFNPANKHSYDVIILDTLDIAQDLAQSYFLEGEGIQYTKNGEVDGFAGWRRIAQWTMDIASGMKSMDAFGVIVIHDREEKAESGAITKRLRLSGSAKDTFAGVPDTVVYLERLRDGDEYITKAYFGTNDNKVTKDRFNFPPEVKNPTIPALFKYIDDKAGVKK